MVFSRTAVHGIYTLCYLNQVQNGTSQSSVSVAGKLGIPRDQAAKVLWSLNNAGLVRSIRGRGGGYVLMKPIDQISVAEVLDALNPPEDDARLRPKSCQRDTAGMCTAHTGLRRLNELVRQALVGETLAGLAGTVCSNSDGCSVESRPSLVCVTEGTGDL